MPQSHADKRRLGRMQISVYLLQDDAKRLERLRERWGLNGVRQVLIEAMRRAEAAEERANER